jgi:hypothetical protein
VKIGSRGPVAALSFEVLAPIFEWIVGDSYNGNKRVVGSIASEVAKPSGKWPSKTSPLANVSNE